MAVKLTHEEYVKKVKNLVGDEYIVTGQYIDSRTSIMIKHMKCNHEKPYKPSAFLDQRKKGADCNYCYRYTGKSRHSSRKTHEQFIKEVHDLTGEEYSVIGTYDKAIVKIEMKHNKCGTVYKVSPNGFLTGSRCLSCAPLQQGLIRRKTHEDFVEQVHSIHGDNITILERYETTHVKIEVQCNACSHIWKARPSGLISKRGCPRCVKKTIGDLYRKSVETFKKEVYELVGDEYSVAGEYKTTNEKIDMKHNKCGHTWGIAPSKFLHDRRCPMCNESRGERAIRKYLEDNGISFEVQYELNGLNGVGNKPLRFDFAIIKNSELEMLIEYDGELHFENKMDDLTFENQKEHDKRKNNYCKNHRIKLLRIPYWEFNNIEAILNNTLNATLA